MIFSIIFNSFKFLEEDWMSNKINHVLSIYFVEALLKYLFPIFKL